MNPFQNLAPELMLLVALLGASLLFVLIIVVVQEISSHISHRRRVKMIKELAGKDPELARRLLEEESASRARTVHRILPIAKHAKVIVFHESGNTLEDVCRVSKGMLKCSRIGMQFVIPEDYVPSMSQVGKKLYPLFVFDSRGVALKVSLNNRGKDAEAVIDEYVPDPRITESIIGREALSQIFRSLGGINLSGVVTGVGIGLLISYVILFVVLPLMGIPVQVGRVPVEVSVEIPQPWPGQLPPPGNYTVPGAGG